MSKYTTEVRFICEHYAGYDESQGGKKVNEIIDKSWNKIFDNFEIFDERYRSVLCKKILKHYYLREISEETAGLWILKLNTKMEEIMPYYNKLYRSELLEFDPFIDVDMKRHHTLDREGSETSKTDTENSRTDNINDTVTNKGEKWNMYSNTPQGGLTGVEENTYLTEATKDTDNTKNTRTGNNKSDFESSVDYSGNTENNDVFDETIKGKTGGKSYSKLLSEYRDILINIDMMIIDELKDLFFKLW